MKTLLKIGTNTTVFILAKLAKSLIGIFGSGIMRYLFMWLISYPSLVGTGWLGQQAFKKGRRDFRRPSHSVRQGGRV